MDTPLLQVEHLKLYYPVRSGLFGKKRFVRAVDDISLVIRKGETVGLVGESGCGKSSLGRAIVRLETPQSGKILLNGQNLLSLKGRVLRKHRRNLQMIFQDPYGSLNPRLSIRSALDEVLRLHSGLDKAARTARAEELMTMVGLDPSQLDRYPHQFSGGQRQRIGIARALASDPALIVADEPVSALDVSVQASIINLLQEIREKTGTAFLFIAHDLAVVEHISSRIAVMYLGRIMESGPSHEVCAHPRHPYTRALLSAVPTIQPDGKKRILLNGDVPSPLSPPEGCPFHPRCPYAQECCRRACPPLTEDQTGRAVRCFAPLEPEKKSMTDTGE
ncbi:MAG: dipeptide ABC transporter ATP-binding protein [Lentisphaeria bacterium]|nr:dipeptide ABC transporter ATP-binding protein [Lentisphaeria bacterium]